LAARPETYDEYRRWRGEEADYYRIHHHHRDYYQYRHHPYYHRYTIGVGKIPTK
jgi:hypothetical protein